MIPKGIGITSHDFLFLQVRRPELEPLFDSVRRVTYRRHVIDATEAYKAWRTLLEQTREQCGVRRSNKWGRNTLCDIMFLVDHGADAKSLVVAYLLLFD